MKAVKLVLISILIVCCNSNHQTTTPPLAPENPIQDTYYGIKITDSYRYMENLQDSNVIKWFKDQAVYSRSVLDKIPGRKKLLDKMIDFDSRLSTKIELLKITENDKYFYLKTTPDDETGKLFFRDGYNGQEVLLFDPVLISKETGKKFVISSIYPTYDGATVAFETAPDGSESTIINIIDVATKKIYPEKIDRCFNTYLSWLPDGRGFTFERLNSAKITDLNRALDSKNYLHLLGNDPSFDKEIFSRGKYPELNILPEEIPYIILKKGCDYMLGLPVTVQNNPRFFYAPITDLKKEKIAWKPLFSIDDLIYDVILDGDDIYIYTPKNAPNFKIIQTTFSEPDLAKAKTIVAENADGRVLSYGFTNEGIYYTISTNGVKEDLYFLRKGENTGKIIDLPIPAGKIKISTKGTNFPDVWIEVSGWTSDTRRFKYNSQNDQIVAENLSTIAEYPEYNNLVVEELMIPSHDNVMVPLSLIYEKGLKRNGNNPVLLYGYGAYGISLNPFFNPNILQYTQYGGIFAIAHIRGGGELGETWYKGGFKTSKPNTWKDFIASAEYLIKEGYTSSEKLSILGGSAGGILIGMAVNERPDLFAAAIPAVGAMNTLRSEESPNGPVNATEFGTVNDSLECMALIQMDSYLNLKVGVRYPASLITAGMNDPRVIAWEPAKYAAKLQKINLSDKPILFLPDFDTGHGIGNEKSKTFERYADWLSFALWQTGHSDFQIK